MKKYLALLSILVLASCGSSNPLEWKLQTTWEQNIKTPLIEETVEVVETQTWTNETEDELIESFKRDIEKLLEEEE